jgi:DNA-binding response OmpR family regulator
MDSLFLIIESDERVALQRRHEFARLGIRCYHVPSLPHAMQALASWAFDAVLMRAPALEERCMGALKRLRARSEAPILLLVDPADERREIEALECGATDVLASSASCELVALKLRRLLELRGRPARAAAVPAQTVGSLALDERSGLASVDGSTLDLTPHQFQLMAALASKSGEVVSRLELRNILAGASDVRVVDVHVSRIRKKLKGMNADDVVLRTVRGRGYSLMANA